MTANKELLIKRKQKVVWGELWKYFYRRTQYSRGKTHLALAAASSRRHHRPPAAQRTTAPGAPLRRGRTPAR